MQDATRIPTSPEMLDDEIDLRQYIDVLIAWRWEILATTVVGALLAAGAVLGMRMIETPVYAATSTVAIARTSSDINFDENFRTLLSEQNLAAAAASTRRSALVGLVSNGAVAETVAALLDDHFDEAERIPTELMTHIDAQAVTAPGSRTEGDLIQITASADTPEKAAALSNAWAHSYVDHVNRLYGAVPEQLIASVQDELSQAQIVYESAQRELEAFIGDNEISRLDRQMVERQQIIASLQAGKQTALQTIIDEELAARRQAISVQVSARLQGLAQSYDTRQTLERLLGDARGLLTQVTAAQEADAATNALALLLLKSQVYNTAGAPAAPLSRIGLRDLAALNKSDANQTITALSMLLLKDQDVNTTGASTAAPLQLRLDDLLALSSSAETQAAELMTLVGVIEGRIAELTASIAAQTQLILANDGETLLDAGLDAGDPLFAVLQGQYASLFDLALLSETQSRDLLQLQGLDALPVGTAAAPLTEAIDALESEIKALQSQREAENSRRDQLISNRDLALKSLNTLKSKTAELQLAGTALTSEVRFASPALPPLRPQAGASLGMTIALGALVGLFLGVFVAFFANYMGRAPLLQRRA